MKAKILWVNSEIIEKELTPMKAIRAKCMQCANYQFGEIEKCPCHDCALFNFRSGHNPDIKPRVLTEEQKQVVRERFKNARQQNSDHPTKAIANDRNRPYTTV